MYRYWLVGNYCSIKKLVCIALPTLPVTILNLAWGHFTTNINTRAVEVVMVVQWGTGSSLMVTWSLVIAVQAFFSKLRTSRMSGPGVMAHEYRVPNSSGVEHRAVI